MNKITSTQAEITRTDEYFNFILSNLTVLPISFVYGGKKYSGFNDEFEVETKRTQIDEKKGSLIITAKHFTGLKITLEAAIYSTYGALEWTVYFENTSESESLLLENINAADMHLTGESPLLHYLLGDGNADAEPFRTYDLPLQSCMSLEFCCPDGRPSEYHFPYYNFEFGNGGMFLIIGWPGQWKSRFENVNNSTHFTAGQATFSSVLKPRETIRTPLMAFLLYDGRDENRATNLWRRWFIDCNMRKINNELFNPVIGGATSTLYGEMAKATDENQIQAIKAYADNGVNLDYWWMDAGWYYKTGEVSLDVWLDTGTWIVDKKRFPSEFKAISDYGATVGTKTLLWFEPEVVRLDLNLLTDVSIKREWVIGYNHAKAGDWLLADMGNIDFREWLIERVSSIIIKGGISLYRQDYGICPLGHWKSADTFNRQGMTENLYVQGYLSFWDELIRRFPTMMIDACASGGRRNDLESMRRAIPLHKTDADYGDHTLKQGMHQSLYKWFPYYGTPLMGLPDKYSLRSAYVPWINFCYDIRRDDIDYKLIRECVAEWKRLNSYFYSDYYTLTPWNRDSDKWIGWQFIDPEKGEGVIQLFRRENSTVTEMLFPLHGLDADATYELEDFDNGTIIASGNQLINFGYNAVIPNPRGSAVVLIKRCI